MVAVAQVAAARGDERVPLLFLCHRIPYPPNKGDKIRAFHLLHHLARHFDVHLATFVDDPADWAYTGDVRKHCASALFAPLKPWQATLRSLVGLLSGEALTLPYYRDRGLARCVELMVLRHRIRHAIVYSSAMSQYLPGDGAGFARRVADFVDVDSDKWLQYGARKRWPLSWVYRREGERLLAHEQAVARAFDAGLFVSAAEAALFRRLTPDAAERIGHYANGVNADYFVPGQPINPFPADARALVFTGAMDYWPNVDAVCWFAREVFPALRAAHPDLSFYVVGGSPTPEVRALAGHGVTVTGRVPDVRPYLDHALAAVAPLRVARGVQNKVLEGMAMARPVLVTAKGLEGIGARDREEVLVAESPADFLRCVDELLAGAHVGLGERARDHVRRSFSLDDNLPEVVSLLGGPAAARADAASHA